MIIPPVGPSGSIGTDGWTNGHRDMRNLIIASRNFPNTPKKQLLFFFISVDVNEYCKLYIGCVEWITESDGKETRLRNPFYSPNI